MSKKSVSKTIGNKSNVFQSIANTIHHVTSLPVSIWAPDKDKTALKIVAAVGLPANYVKTASLDLKKPSVTGDAYKTKTIQVAKDISSDSRWRYKKQAREMNWKSAICVPIEVDSASIGAISVYAYTERSISELRYILPDFAKQIALTLEASKQKEVLQKILDIDAKLQSMSESPKNILQAVVKGACEITGANCAVVYPFDADRGEFYDIENIASYGLKKELKVSEKPRTRGGMAAYIKQRGEITLANIEI
jgi:signal transduction protein with GAF and PtsI domain